MFHLFQYVLQPFSFFCFYFYLILMLGHGLEFLLAFFVLVLELVLFYFVFDSFVFGDLLLFDVINLFLLMLLLNLFIKLMLLMLSFQFLHLFEKVHFGLNWWRWCCQGFLNAFISCVQNLLLDQFLFLFGLLFRHVLAFKVFDFLFHLVVFMLVL